MYETLLHDAYVVTTVVALFVSWGLLLAVIVDNAHMPDINKPGMLTRMALFTGVWPITLSTLVVLNFWR